MMRSLSTLILAAVCCMFFFTNCSKDDKKGAYDDLTPEESKKHLQDIGLKLLGKINPEDHKELIQTLETFMDLADEGGLSIETASFAGQFVNTVGNVVSKSDLGGFFAYNTTKAELYQAKDYYGIYTYDENKEEWKPSESTSKLEFVFPANGQTAVITLTASGTEVEVEIEGEKVMVPPAAEGVIKRGTNELCKVNMKNSIDNSSKKADIEATMEVNGGYIFNVVTNLSETLAKAQFSLKKGGENLVSGNCEVSGASMTNSSVIKDIDDLVDSFKDAKATVQVMEDMRVTADCSDIQKMLKELDIDYDDYNTEKEYEEARAAAINKYTDGNMYYDSNTVIAKIEFQAYKEEWTSWDGEYKYEYWETEPVLVFTFDDSRHSFEEYFGNKNFSTLINTAEKLAKDYEKFLK